MTGPGPQLGPQLRGLAEALSGLIGAAAPGTPEDHSAECRTCPVCTALAVLRGQRPELSEALADLLATTAAALRGLSAPVPPTDAGTVPPPDHARTPPEETVSDQPDPTESVPVPPAPVQRIDVA